MDSNTETIVGKLKASKQQGLTYFQATQKLKNEGFTDEQISIASENFVYTDTTADSPGSDNNNQDELMPQSGNEGLTPSDEDELGKELLKDKQNTFQNSLAFIIPALFILGFSFGWALMRLYLVPHWFSPSGPNIFTHSSSYNYSVFVRYAYIYPAVAGIIGGAIVVVIYVIYRALSSKNNN